jgi:thiol-disulfide isomerase/thioredoxin
VSQAVNNASKEIVISQESLNKRVPYKGSVILVGKADRSGLTQAPFAIWFNENLSNYELDTTSIAKLKPLLGNVKIVAFMGTWCKDSKRETPRFYKILDALNFDYDNLELITVTRLKNTSEQYNAELQITHVPTFIFYKDGKELNRIVEFPVESIEK